MCVCTEDTKLDKNWNRKIKMKLICTISPFFFVVGFRYNSFVQGLYYVDITPRNKDDEEEEEGKNIVT